MSETVKQKKKTNSTDRSLKILIGIFALVLVLFGVLLYFTAKKESALKGADQAIRLSAQGGFDCEYAEAQKLYAFGEGVLKVTEDRTAYLTLSGNEVYSKNIKYTNPQCYIRDGKAVVFDYNGYAFMVLDKDQVVFEKPTENKVKGAKLSDNGKCAIITDSDEGYGKVTIYDEKGSFIAAWESSDSGYPIDVTFSKDDSFFAISTVNTMGAVNRPYIRLFAIVDTGTKFSASDYGLYTSDDAQLFGSVVYGGNRLFTFTANKIFTLENDKLVALSGEYGAINYVNSVDDMLFMIYSDGINQKNSLAIINSKGETIYDSLIGSSVNAVSVKDDKYAVSVDNRIYIFKSNGNVISDISVDEEVLRIGFIENDKLVVISTGGVHTINY